MLAKDELCVRLYPFLETRDLLNFLNACKLHLRKKSRSLAHRIFTEATVPIVCIGFGTKKETSIRLGKGVSDLLDAINNITLFSFWNLYIQYEALKIEDDFKYNTNRQSIEELNIEVDIGRTIPDKLKSEESKSILKIVLVALSNSIPNLGYIQGLNSIVGLLTLGILDIPDFKSGDHECIVQQIVYSNMKYFLVQRGFLMFYTDGFIRYRGLCIQLGLMTKAILPDISQHFVGAIDSGQTGIRTGAAYNEMVLHSVF